MKPALILVVDDEPFFRELYSETLSTDGYRVEAADSGEEALRRIQRGGIDVVLTDLVMKGFSGLDLLRAVRKMMHPPEVILVTANATIESAIEAIKNGARDYLIKPFNPEELRHLIRTCLDQRQVLNENIHLKQQIRLFQKGQSLAFLLDIDKLLPQAVEFLTQEVRDGRGFAFLLADGEPGHFIHSDGLTPEGCKAMTDSLLPRFQTLSGISFLQMQDIPADQKWPAAIHALCLIPLLYQKKLEGGIVIFNPEQPENDFHFPYEQLNFLAQQATLGFANSYRFKGAQDLIYTDDLTGLYNFRYLNLVLQQELLRTRRYGLTFALVFIDLDYFKEVNDNYGHLAGSQTLREVAMLLRESVRETDLLFRYGGDEFTALLVETDADGALLVSERIRRKIENHVFLADSIAYSKLTATVGYAIFPHDAKNQKKLMELADRAMYHGKKMRNTVCSVKEYFDSKKK
ncbi:MAG: diguanylate cyclase [Deltaproteobacteria bacterium]|nr:diguanylate cyclase [Deltaproteobacteria bacterium]